MNLRQQQMARKKSQEKYFTLICHQKQEKWSLNAKIIPFSEYLSTIDEDQDLDNQQNLFTLPIPQFIYVDQQIIQLTSLFYLMHNYRKDSIKINKINIRGLRNSIDKTSFQYIEHHLKDKEEQFYKKLMNFCEFLKLNYLKDLVCALIASKYDFVFDQKQIQRQLQKRRIFYSKQMQINLKKQLFTYSKHVGLQLLQRYRDKVQKEKDKHF